jgi:hypothetical protein
MCNPKTDQVDRYDEQTRSLPVPRAMLRDAQSSVKPVVSGSKEKTPVSSHPKPATGASDKQKAMQQTKERLQKTLGESSGPDTSAEGVQRTSAAAKQLVRKVQAAAAGLGDAGAELEERCEKLLKQIDQFKPAEGTQAAREAKSLLDQAENLLKSALDVLGSVTEASAGEMIRQATEAEKSVTPVLQELAKTHGFEPIGLEYRLKSPKSLKDKLSRDMIEEGKPLDQVAQNVSDVLRYTASFPSERLAEGTDGVLRDLQQKGYTLLKLKNTWPDDKISYKGINVQMATPDGQKMELQFHTSDSFWLKDTGTHDLYEEKRRPDISKERKDQLDYIQAEMAKLLDKPPGIDKIENFPGRK